MRLQSWAILILASLALPALGGPPAMAENDGDRFRSLSTRAAPAAPDGRRRTQRAVRGAERYEPRYGGQAYRPAPPSTPTLYYGPNGYYYLQPAPREAPRSAALPREAYRPVPQPQPAPEPFSFFRRFQQPQPEPPPVAEPRVRERRPVARPRPRPAQPQVAQEQEEPEVEPTTFFVVFGDSLAAHVSTGLEEAFEDTPEVAVEDKTRGDSGLVRSDFYDWPKAVQDYLATNPKISAAVMMLGVNDRQAIKEGDVSHEPFSPRWRDIYRERIDAIAKSFIERRIPLIWVGLPPMRNERSSKDMIALNEMLRERVQRAGGIYVDLWEAFVDDDNRYAQSGPDLGGQTARLRAGDGIHFTRAGGRKAAHFADVEIKRLMEARIIAPAVAALPAPGEPKEDGPPSVERLIDAALPDLPQPPGVPGFAPRPVAGPVVPLTRVETSPNGTLAARRPRADDSGLITDQVLNQGIAPTPRPGRADDFSWPKAN